MTLNDTNGFTYRINIFKTLTKVTFTLTEIPLSAFSSNF